MRQTTTFCNYVTLWRTPRLLSFVRPRTYSSLFVVNETIGTSNHVELTINAVVELVTNACIFMCEVTVLSWAIKTWLRLLYKNQLNRNNAHQQNKPKPKRTNNSWNVCKPNPVLVLINYLREPHLRFMSPIELKINIHKQEQNKNLLGSSNPSTIFLPYNFKYLVKQTYAVLAYENSQY